MCPWPILVEPLASMHLGTLLLQAVAVRALQTAVDLTALVNNKAAAIEGSLASFDGHNGSYPAEYLPTGILVDDAISYTLPNFTDMSTYDNINCSGQTISLPSGNYHSFNFLGATDGIGYVNGEFTALYDDNTTEPLGFVVAPWWLKNPSDGPITAPFLNMGLSNGTTFRNSHHLDNSKTLTGLMLPNETGSSQLTGVISIHVFAITLVSADEPVTADAPVLDIQNVRSTTKFRLVDNVLVQLYEVTLNNFAPSTAGAEAWITRNTTITLESTSLKTIIPGSVQHLRGGDQVRIVVGVVNEDCVEEGTPISDVQVLVDGVPVGNTWDAIAGIPDYYVGDDSLMTHESAEWFDNAKFGLFVHWGIYSVPAWTVSGTQYAEWYWYWQHNPANESSAVWTHHKELYGEDFLYDDFFPDFTADKFDATEFVQFVADIGAKYYVITTKHHDGFALFDTGNSSNRNSLIHGPQRDLVGEIINATKASQPQLRSGLYFSVPEWFNPAFAKYGHAGGGDDLYHREEPKAGYPGYNILQRTGFAGGLAQNAYNSSEYEPYTGYIEKEDFIQDIMKPQMETLFYQYSADILWCDVGGDSAFPEIASTWFNWAKANGRQVLANARCGANYSDFDTHRVHLETRKWESSEGSDPYSYGYNQDTPDENYRNATYILRSLVDIVSKNGNYLIDVGQRPMGPFGDAIYDTQYWYVTADEGDLRFTTKPDAFYITSLAYPVNGTIRSTSPLPLKEGDVATFLGPNITQKALCWTWNDGVFELYADEAELKGVEDAWAFKITYA
ncbi:alpha-L-fucosidase-domain-containing protein [Mucidula mucida]|nr:alpha-L-fucosidase-domain-containing protein [Mucidula mucida]